jgi:hypothetical protein
VKSVQLRLCRCGPDTSDRTAIQAELERQRLLTRAAGIRIPVDCSTEFRIEVLKLIDWVNIPTGE